MNYVAPTAPQSIGGVLDDWLRLFRSSFKRCWPVALICVIAAACAQYLVTPKFPAPGLPPMQYLASMESTLRAPVVVLTDIALWLITMLVYGALLTQQVAVLRGGEAPALGEALNKSVRRLPQMLLGVLLLVLIMSAFGVPIGIGAIVFIAFRHSPMAVVLAALGLLAIVILAIYLSVRLQYWLAAIFAEDCGGAGALGRSWNLVKGNWWRVAAFAFVATIIIWILSLAIGAVVGVLAGWFALHNAGPADFLNHMRLVAAFGAVARVLTMPLLTAAWLAIYHDLTLRREGGDLATRAEALSGR